MQAPPDVVWALFAQPRRWVEWAPHVRSPRGLGVPEVEAGCEGNVRIGGAVPVPVRIVSVDPGRAWTWEVGPMRLGHSVEPADGGTLARIEIRAGALEPALALSYGPVVSLLLRNLARIAAREA